MKKIIIVLNSSWQAYNFRLNLAKHLDLKGYKVTFMAPADDYYSNIIKKKYDFFNIHLQANRINPLKDFILFIELLILYKKIKPDIVLNFTIKPNIYSTLAASLLNIFSISNITGLGTVFIKRNFLTKIVIKLYSLSLHRSSKIFFQNNNDMSLFLDKKIVKLENCILIPGSGVDTIKFSPSINNIRIDSNFRFLIVSRLLKDKGIYEFIEAARILKQKYKKLEFWVVGEINPYNKSSFTKSEITQLSKDSVINFFERTDDINFYLNKVDCVVLPSYREGSPRSIMEASSSALPVIVSDVPGCRQVVDNNITGLYCEVRNYIDLADKMEVMYKMSNKERQAMGKNGRKKMIDQYDESIVLKSYSQEIFNLLDQ